MERLWRDVESVITVITALFLFLEGHNYLDPNNELDNFGLHSFFSQRDQRMLDRFRERFSFHSVNPW